MRDWLLGGLVLLAVVQLALLGATAGSSNESRWLGPGDNLGSIPVADANGVSRSLATGSPTLVLVFHSECGHCQRVAPAWREWLDEHRDETRILSISSEDASSAQAYVAGHAWRVDTWTVTSPKIGSPAHALTSRTPWLFLVDPDGVVIAEGHGDEIDEIGRLMTGDIVAVDNAP